MALKKVGRGVDGMRALVRRRFKRDKDSDDDGGSQTSMTLFVNQFPVAENIGFQRSKML
jgi:hypothetical protein